MVAGKNKVEPHVFQCVTWLFLNLRRKTGLFLKSLAYFHEWSDSGFLRWVRQQWLALPGWLNLFSQPPYKPGWADYAAGTAVRDLKSPDQVRTPLSPQNTLFSPSCWAAPPLSFQSPHSPLLPAGQLVVVGRAAGVGRGRQNGRGGTCCWAWRRRESMLSVGTRVLTCFGNFKQNSRLLLWCGLKDGCDYTTLPLLDLPLFQPDLNGVLNIKFSTIRNICESFLKLCSFW